MNSWECDLSLHFMLEHSFDDEFDLKGCMYNGIFLLSNNIRPVF